MFKRVNDKYQTWLSNRRIARMARAVANNASPNPNSRPVIFFNASARLGHLSQNAAFSLLSAWGLRLAGVPIVHFVCNAGITRCVLGTNSDDPAKLPPCAACVAQSKHLYSGADVHWFPFSKSAELESAMANLDLPALQDFAYEGMPLGDLVQPSLRWALRRYHLNDDESTRFLCRQYILSAFSLAQEFSFLLEKKNPQAVVVFNGIMFPEAVARQVALKHTIRVITHEVGLLPFSAFFTDGQATAYPMSIPPEFSLSPDKDRQLDAYLSKRFEGDFSMAGIRFWPQMQQLDEAFLAKTAKFKKIVPVFTNVIFDTSQVHANRHFPHMFAWLDEVHKLIRNHPDALFVIRAHPDEHRPGTRKQSRESVAQWVRQYGVDRLSNVVFIDSTEYLSSYALIQRAHFVMVYNSSIGLEASIMGKPVLCAGAARYTQYETVYYPKSGEEYICQATKFLESDRVDQPEEYIREARRVLYFQLFRTALPFDRYLYAHARMGYVHLRSFELDDLLPSNSPAIHAITSGVVDGQPFLV